MVVEAIRFDMFAGTTTRRAFIYEMQEWLNEHVGSGKTLLAKTLSILAAEQGIPTVVINEPYAGDNFNKFMQDIEQPCIILFDEFEKVYNNEAQEHALTLLDGVFPSKKLFVITCNDKWRVNEHMRNRPGRIYYMLDFSGLDSAFIAEYCDDNLKNNVHTQKVVEIAALFEQFNFDMLKALIEEMNRYDETPQEALRMLNAKPEYNNKGKFEFVLTVGGVDKTANTNQKQWQGNPLAQNIHLDWDTDPDGDDDDTWRNSNWAPSHIKVVDAPAGKFTLINDKGESLTLTRVKETGYNYLAF